METTVRQKIIQLLLIKPHEAQGISRILGVSQRSVESHLEHVMRSVGNRFEIVLPECRDCGFRFRGRDRVTKPSKCPKCKEEDISPPYFSIKPA